jgi:hypothetical protein
MVLREDAPVRKIPTIYDRDWDGNPKFVTREENPECSWVFAGAGTPTLKWDGTCVMFDGTDWWARREVKPGKAAPAGFVTLSTDEETGKTVGWEPMVQSAFARWHAEAEAAATEAFEPGTYELLGPKINGNPDGFPGHALMRHALAPGTLDTDVKTAPRDFDGLRDWLHARPYEGIVWHHPDGRMAKIKARDFPRAGSGS